MQLIKLCNIEEVIEGLVKSILTPYGAIGITKINGEIVAFQDECTHDGSPFDNAKIEKETFEIICPRHGARFDLRSGKVTKPPAYENIEIYKIQIINNQIYVEIED